MLGRTARYATLATLQMALLLLLVPVGPDQALAAPTPGSGSPASTAATTTSTPGATPTDLPQTCE